MCRFLAARMPDEGYAKVEEGRWLRWFRSHESELALKRPQGAAKMAEEWNAAVNKHPEITTINGIARVLDEVSSLGIEQVSLAGN